MDDFGDEDKDDGKSLGALARKKRKKKKVGREVLKQLTFRLFTSVILMGILNNGLSLGGDGGLACLRVEIGAQCLSLLAVSLQVVRSLFSFSYLSG